MTSVTVTDSKPRCRNSRPAAFRIVCLFSSTRSRLTLIVFSFRFRLTIIHDDDHDIHHVYKERLAMNAKPAVLVTGSSTGIGSVYADRFARRGHDLVLVARNAARLAALAERLRGETGVTVDVVPADLTDAQDLARIERRLREDARIGVLVNNAGTTIRSGFLNQGSEDLSRLLAVNVTAVTRLANAAASRFVKAGEG